MTSPIASLAASCVELNIAQKPGVYVLLLGDEVVYVGQSNNVLYRAGSHAGRFGFDRALFIPEPRRLERMAIEGALAGRFNPIHCDRASRRHTTRDREILARFGLEPDATNAAAFRAREAENWVAASRARQARAQRRRDEQHREYRERWLALRSLLWQAVQPHLGGAA